MRRLTTATQRPRYLAALATFMVLCSFVNSCAHLEVVRLPSQPSAASKPTDGTIQLRLTQPAWEVELDDGAPLADVRVRARAVNVADPEQVYTVRLIPGLLDHNRLKIVEPSPSIPGLRCGANRTTAPHLLTLVICPELLAEVADFPTEEDILARFRNTGQRVFIFVRPERSALPKP